MQPMQAGSCSCAHLQEKDYVMASETKDMLQKSEGTKIEWKAGKDPTVKVRRCRSDVVPSEPWAQQGHAQHSWMSCKPRS